MTLPTYRLNNSVTPSPYPSINKKKLQKNLDFNCSGSSLLLVIAIFEYCMYGTYVVSVTTVSTIISKENLVTTN